MSSYTHQHRGDPGAYQRYLQGMDAAMQQKVALTAAYLLNRGTIADMGMGSGSGSFALASLYPALRVIGVDVNPEMVRYASDKYRLANLEFVEGDIGQVIFERGSLDGIFNSSVLHHVTTFNDYDLEAASGALANQVEQLAPYGTLVVRDFLRPAPGLVTLDLPDSDGTGEDPRTCSSACLLLRFSREFRGLRGEGFPCQELSPPEPGWRRFQLDRRHAVEFLLRKDYRQDWETEVLEEYTYFDQARFEAEFARLGLRVLASAPLWNGWIVRNRFVGKFRWDEPLPPTNYVIVGEKVPAGEGVRFREVPDQPLGGFLQLTHHRDRRDGRIYDLVRRPHPTVDAIPFFEQDGELFVVARTSYPRPLLVAAGSRLLDESLAIGYDTEPLTAIQRELPLGDTVAEMLWERAGIAGTDILECLPGAHYYPSPGGVQEEVRSIFVRIQPGAFAERPASGRLQAIEATQLLRAAQVGGLSDARLEINVYQLMRRLGRDPGPWIGEPISCAPCATPLQATPLPALVGRPNRRVFEPVAAGAGFLRLCCSRFEELDAGGRVVSDVKLEYVVPSRLSCSTVVVAVLARVGDRVLLGVDDDDLPAAQGFSGNSQLLVPPAWRLPPESASRARFLDFMRAALSREYGVVSGRVWELGGRYFPSPGTTPEAVYPFAVEALEAGPQLRWIDLEELRDDFAVLRVGHLRTLAMRAMRALA